MGRQVPLEETAPIKEREVTVSTMQARLNSPFDMMVGNESMLSVDMDRKELIKTVKGKLLTAVAEYKKYKAMKVKEDLKALSKAMKDAKKGNGFMVYPYYPLFDFTVPGQEYLKEVLITLKASKDKNVRLSSREYSQLVG